MAEETGSVSAYLEPVLSIRLAEGETVECVVDAGFTEELALPESLVGRLGLPIIGLIEIETAGGYQVTASVALARIEWLGAMRAVEVVVLDSFLVGTKLLDGTRLVVDYVAYTVTVSDLKLGPDA